MGLSPSRVWFNMRTDKLIIGLENCLESVDDLLFQAASIEDLEALLEKFVTRCKDNDVQISEKKFKSMTRLKFGGSVIDTEDDEVKIKPDEDKVERIRNFPSPKTRAELKSFMGMARTFDMWTGNLVRLSSEMA